MDTHAIVPTAPNKITELRTALAGDALKQITNYYGGNKEEALRFATACIEYVRKVPKLLACDRTSLVMAFVTSAQFRFMPSSVGGEAYVIPYGREAKFQLGYQGIVTLLYRSRVVKGITANIIYANDDFVYEEGLEAKLVHKPAMFGKPAGDPIGAYTVVQLAGGARTFKVMDKDAIMAIKALSKAKDVKDSPWNSDKDPELWMWKKTCLIQHAKLLPKTQDIQRAIELDYEGEGIDKGNLNAEGVATAKAPHAPHAPAAIAAAATEAPDTGKLCPAGKHDAKHVSDGDCMACLDEALAEPAPAQQEDIQIEEPAEEAAPVEPAPGEAAK